ncbi:MAG: NAD-dependent epimerase/dehydratase family protein, partial [Sandaracinaceae bacterium]
MSAIVVTGATGFLGGALVRELRRDGHEVVATGRDRSKGDALARETAARFVAGDLAIPSDASARSAARRRWSTAPRSRARGGRPARSSAPTSARPRTW